MSAGINFSIDQDNINVIANNDSYDAFKVNLIVLELAVSALNEKIDLKIETIRYGINHPLDFNRMIVSSSNEQPYLLEFKNYKLVNCTRINI